MDVGLAPEDTDTYGTGTTKQIFLQYGEPLYYDVNLSPQFLTGDELTLTYRFDAGSGVDGWVVETANDAYTRRLFTLTSVTQNTYIIANENFGGVKDVSAFGSGGTQSSIQSVVDNLESTSQTDALSANQGRILNNTLTGKQDTIIFTGESATLKTINGQSLQGPGNLIIKGGGDGTGGTVYYEGTGITISTANTISISNQTWGMLNNKYDKTGGTVYGSVEAEEEVSAYGSGGTVSSVQSVIDNLESNSQTDALSARQGKVLNQTKQDTLVSGTNIKTINGESILGEGDIVITGGSATGGTYNEGTGITISSNTISISNSTWQLIDSKYDKTGGTVSGSVFALEEVSSYGTGGTQSSIQSVINNLTSDSETDALSAKQGKVLSGLISGKQDTLISGTNIKTINGSALTGEGNLIIETTGGGATYTAGTGITISSDTISVSTDV